MNSQKMLTPRWNSHGLLFWLPRRLQPAPLTPASAGLKICAAWMILSQTSLIVKDTPGSRRPQAATPESFLRYSGSSERLTRIETARLRRLVWSSRLYESVIRSDGQQIDSELNSLSNCPSRAWQVIANVLIWSMPMMYFPSIRCLTFRIERHPRQGAQPIT